MIFIILGLAIGGLLLLLSKPTNRIRFLTYAGFIGLLLYCTVIASFQIHDRYHSRNLTNIEANEDFLNSNASYPQQEKQAFKLLTDQYKDPNDLRLIAATVSRYDSTIRTAKTDVYDIGFVYFRKQQEVRYRSSCTIIGNQGKLHYFDRPLNQAEEHQMDSSSNAGLSDALKAMLADSAKLPLDSAAKATIRNELKTRNLALDTLYR